MASSRSRRRTLDSRLVLLHEDDHILVVDKPPGLLTIATAKERAKTAYYILTDYVRGRSGRSRNRVYIVHRLDRETSGLLVFARTPEAKQKLQSGWKETEKTYLAVVHGKLESPEALLESHLAENKAYVVYATSNPKEGKLARTGYRVLKQAKAKALLEVDLLTGRMHQIRVQLADIGHPIVGDTKYGKPGSSRVRLGLHALALSIVHPATGRRLSFQTDAPPWFHKQVGGPDDVAAADNRR